MAEAPLGDAGGTAITMAFVPTIDPGATGAERLAMLARAPFEEAIGPLRSLPAEVHVAYRGGLTVVAVVAGGLLLAMCVAAAGALMFLQGGR